MATKTTNQSSEGGNSISDAIAVFHVQCPHCEKPFLARDTRAQASTGQLAAQEGEHRLTETQRHLAALTGVQDQPLHLQADVSRTPSNLLFWSLVSSCVGLASFLVLFLRSQRHEAQPLPTRLAPVWHTNANEDTEQTPKFREEMHRLREGKWHQSREEPATDDANEKAAHP